MSDEDNIKQQVRQQVFRFINHLYPAIVEHLPHISKLTKWGYALHGSMARDLDILATPWTDDALEIQAMLQVFIAEIATLNPYTRWANVDDDGTILLEKKPLMRLATQLNLGMGAYIDISIIDSRECIKLENLESCRTKRPIGLLEQYIQTKLTKPTTETGDMYEGTRS